MKVSPVSLLQFASLERSRLIKDKTVWTLTVISFLNDNSQNWKAATLSSAVAYVPLADVTPIFPILERHLFVMSVQPSVLIKLSAVFSFQENSQAIMHTLQDGLFYHRGQSYSFRENLWTTARHTRKLTYRNTSSSERTNQLAARLGSAPSLAS